MPDASEEVTETELYAYMGLLLLFGVTKKNDVDISEIYNKNSPHFCPTAALTFPRDRFQEIYQYIAFDDIDTRDTRAASDPKFFKARQIFKHFKEKILCGLEPFEQLCVDETLYSFRGKCSFRQYMPQKPNRYCLKYWHIVDCATGYVLNTDIYLGKEGNSEAPSKNIGQNVVLQLCKPYYRSGRGITTDNFFTAIPLAQKLWEEGLTLLGTIRKNKPEMLHSFLPSKQKTIHSSLFAFCGPLTLCSYVPKVRKVVTVLSTQHHDMSVSNSPEKKPSMIISYNETKGAVDSLDQRIERFTCRRRTPRWTLNLFFYLLDVGAANSVVMTGLANPSILASDPHRFRRKQLEKLSMELTKPCIETRMTKWRQNRQGIQENLVLLAKSFGFWHDTKSERASEVLRLQTSGRCQMCGRQRDRKTRTTCTSCGSFVCKDHQRVICSDCLQ